MKLCLTIVIISAVFGAVLCGKEEWEENQKTCSKELKVEIEDAKNALQGKTKEADVAANVKCFFKCMSEKCGIFKNGALQPQVLIEKHSTSSNKELVAKTAIDCNLKGADDCDTAFKVASCIDKKLMISENM